MANTLKTRMLLADDISLSLKDSLSVRKSTPGDLPRLQEIFSLAREFMAQSGNPSQWSPDYPGEALLRSDIGSKDSYVVEHRGIVIATFVLREGEDPTYKVIYEGEWLDKGPYATIHRIASDGSVKGILHLSVQFALRKYRSIRIDTHRDNSVMRAALLREGFRYCGIIRCWNGSERLAYQYVSEASEDHKDSN